MARDIVNPANGAGTADEMTLSALAIVLTNVGSAVADRLRRALTILWRNPYGIAPARAFAALGDRGVRAVERMEAMQQFVATQAPNETGVNKLVPDGWTLTKNPDGTVTVAKVP